MWSAEHIEWLRRASPAFIAAWMDGARSCGSPRAVPDERYFVYGEAQDAVAIRDEYLQDALQISAWGDAAVYLLNPRVVTAAGEWEAWFFATWIPGAHRYRTFWDLMCAEHESFLELERS